MKAVSTILALFVADGAVAAEVLTPVQARQQPGAAVTVELRVKAAGSNPAGFVELYSEASWRHEDCFFVRFPKETQKLYRLWDLVDIGKH